MIRLAMEVCEMCGGSGQITEIVEHRGGWVYKPRRCDECGGFGKVDK